MGEGGPRIQPEPSVLPREDLRIRGPGHKYMYSGQRYNTDRYPTDNPYERNTWTKKNKNKRRTDKADTPGILSLRAPISKSFFFF